METIQIKDIAKIVAKKMNLSTNDVLEIGNSLFLKLEEDLSNSEALMVIFPNIGTFQVNRLILNRKIDNLTKKIENCKKDNEKKLLQRSLDLLITFRENYKIKDELILRRNDKRIK